MRHEPSGSRLPVQPAPTRRCPACRVAKPSDDFPAWHDPGADCCAACRRRRAAVARRRDERALRMAAHRGEVSYQALLARHAPGGGGSDAA
jgi:hypothetical protein